MNLLQTANSKKYFNALINELMERGIKKFKNN